MRSGEVRIDFARTVLELLVCQRRVEVNRLMRRIRMIDIDGLAEFTNNEFSVMTFSSVTVMTSLQSTALTPNKPNELCPVMPLGAPNGPQIHRFQLIRDEA